MDSTGDPAGRLYKSVHASLAIQNSTNAVGDVGSDCPPLAGAGGGKFKIDTTNNYALSASHKRKH